MNFEDLDILWAALRRAVRRVWWLLPLPLLVGAGLFFLTRPTGPAYEARATVVATQTSLPVEQLLVTAAELFHAGAVEEALADLDGTGPSSSGAGVDLQAVAGAPVLYVVGRGDTRAEAVEAANRAADAFLEETEALSELARFATFVEAEPSTATRVQATLPVLASVAVGVALLVAILGLAVALEGPFRPVGSTRRLSRAVDRPVGLIWADGAKVTLDPTFRRSLPAGPAIDWSVQPLADTNPAVVVELIRQLSELDPDPGPDPELDPDWQSQDDGPDGDSGDRTDRDDQRSSWQRLVLVPAEMRLGAVLLDERLAKRGERFDWQVGLLASPSHTEPDRDEPTA